MSIRIVSRQEWGAHAPTGNLARQTAPTEAYIHITESPGRLRNIAAQKESVREIQRFHQQTRGWSDVGYHWLVAQPWGFVPVARAFVGREDRYVPAAQAGHNRGTIAIAVLAQQGDPLKRNTRYVIEQLLKRYPSLVSVGGHRDAPGQDTDCPGDVIHSWIPQIARAAGLKVYR